MVKKESIEQTTTPQLNKNEMSEEEIDRNLAGTFPASDPPSWTLGTDHREESPDQQRDVGEDGATE